MATIFLTITCRKPTNHIFECLESVYAQSHRDWVANVVVDDAGEADPAILAQLQAETDPRVIVDTIQGRNYALKNQLDGIDKHCPHRAIVGKLDGDDKLLGTDVLKTISDEYDSDPELDALWTKFKSSKNIKCCCGPLPVDANPLTHGWRTSHFQTFRKSLLWAVRREVFLDPELGTEWRSSCDHALYLPLLVHARKRKFLDKVCYFYRRGAGDNAAKEQKTNASRIRQWNIEHQTFQGAKNVLFIINGPGAGRDKRFYNGERRPPLGVLSMAAHLRARGHQVRLVDRFMDSSWFPEPATLKWADTVGVYVSTPNGADGRDCIRRVRAAGFQGKIATGGPHSILWPEQVKGWGADIVYPGEADFAISEIVETGKFSAREKRIKNLDALPFPAYDLLVEQNILGKYSRGWPFTKMARDVFTLNTSRGCPFSCAFCDVKTVWGRQYYAQSAERVMLDVAEIKRYGAREIYFREDNFCCDPERVKRVCELMPDNTPWACEMRADVGCDPEFVKATAEAGCQGYYVGAESGSDRMLKLMSKGITAEQIVQTCHNAKKYGVYVALSMINGYPGELPEDQVLTKQLLKRVTARHVWKAKYRKPWGQHEQSPVED